MELKQLGKYEIAGKIGQGGMGEVFRAADPVLHRQVAIKTMTTGGDMEEELRKRFLREAHTAALLNHPNIVTVFDFGEEQGRMYIVMELLEGRDLKDLIRGPRLPLETAFGLMEQICQGLAFAHAKGVIHRDLKPANIHVSGDGRVKILDFGLARFTKSDITRTGYILGTPHYMSPEQVKGEKVTSRSDVFSLGAVFHELVSGRKAFDGDSMPTIMYRVMNAEPASLETLRPDAPASLAAVLRRALDKDPARRPLDAGELGRSLRGASARGGVAATVPAGSLGSAASPATARTRPVAEGPTALDSAFPEPTPLEPTLRPDDETLGSEETRVDPPTAPGPAPASGPGPAPPLAPTRVSRPSQTRLDARTGGRGRLLAAAVALVVIAGVAAYVLRPSSEAPVAGDLPETASSPELPAPASPPPPDARSSRQALADRDYRRAVELARGVLDAAPGHAAARETLAEAEDALAKSADLAEQIEAALGRGDSTAATEALGTLVALDPRHPDLPALSKGLEDLVRAKGEEARRATAVARAAPPPAPAPVPAAAEPEPTPVPTPEATPTPVPPPPAPEPTPVPTPSPEDAVLRTLTRYQEACRNVDHVAIRVVFPLIKDKNLKAISKMSRYDIRFEGLEVALEDDRHAVVTGHAFYEATPNGGSRTPTRFDKQETIRMEKVNDSWVIREIE